MGSGSISTFCPKYFSPFPHGTGTLSVSREYLALPDGPGRFTQGYTCPALLRDPPGHRQRSRKRLSRATAGLSRPLPLRCRTTYRRPYNTRRAETRRVWATPLSLATTGGIIVYFLFLEVLRCFSSPRSPPLLMQGIPRITRWVVPFGDHRIKGYLRLPGAFRSLSRPSSPPRA